MHIFTLRGLGYTRCQVQGCYIPKHRVCIVLVIEFTCDEVSEDSKGGARETIGSRVMYVHYILESNRFVHVLPAHACILYYVLA